MLEQLNKEDRAVINNEDTSPSDREAAETRFAERDEELRRVKRQIAERDGEMPLREKIKEIFKKYGFTVTGVLLAVGTKIGVVISYLTNGLKSVAKGIGKGLKELGKKNRLHSARPAGRDCELFVSHGWPGYLLSW